MPSKRELRYSIHNSRGKVVEKGEGGLQSELSYLALKYSSFGKIMSWFKKNNGDV